MKAQGYYKENKKKTNKTREGQFFKYTCDFPIDLEKYQIFRVIDRHACEILDENNCVIWAFKQAGVSDDIIDRMKCLIGTRHFPACKFQEIVDDIQIGVIVRYYRPNDNRTDCKRYMPKEGEPTQVVKLVLFDDHYMIDEPVDATTTGIRKFDEIKAHPKCQNWTTEQILRTERYVQRKDCWEKRSKAETDIMTIMKVLFEIEAFHEIHFGDFSCRTSTLQKEKLAPLTKLKYNPKFCTRKKEQIEYKPKELKPGKMAFKFKKAVYADFECSTDGIHQPYNICALTAGGEHEFSIRY